MRNHSNAYSYKKYLIPYFYKKISFTCSSRTFNKISDPFPIEPITLDSGTGVSLKLTGHVSRPFNPTFRSRSSTCTVRPGDFLEIEKENLLD